MDSGYSLLGMYVFIFCPVLFRNSWLVLLYSVHSNYSRYSRLTLHCCTVVHSVQLVCSVQHDQPWRCLSVSPPDRTAWSSALPAVSCRSEFNCSRVKQRFQKTRYECMWEVGRRGSIKFEKLSIL